MSPVTRVVLADDHALVRAGIRSLLAGMSGVEVVGEAADGHEALRLVETVRPQIVLMDIAMPGLNGLEAAARITREHDRIRVIIVSMHTSEEYASQAFRAGAAGYLLKDAAPDELERAVRAVARGEIYLSPAVSRHVIEDYRRFLAQEPDPLARLTPRHREVLQLVAEGRTTKQIGKLLGVSAKTAESHRTRIMAKLEIHETASLVRYAIRQGLIQP